MALIPAGDRDGSVPLNGKFSIFPEQRLPNFDSGPAVAFAAAAMRDPAPAIVALLCDSRHPPRFDVAPAFRRVDCDGLIRVVDWGVVDWPDGGARRAVVLMERPSGGKVLPSLEAQIVPFKEEPLIRRVIRPMAQLLSEFYIQGITHRNIRPDNLFYDGEADRAPIVLGDGLSAPVAMAQAVAYETIQGGMADPAGRGEGDSSDDLYALGATLVSLLIGRCPFQGMSGEEIVRRKLEIGSFSAMLGDQRISQTAIEIFRGLLHDDPNERWKIDDLDLWVGGRRLSPKQQIMPVKAARPLDFAGKTLFTAPEVAEAFSRHWDAAIAVVTEGTLDHWLRRSLGDDDRTEAVKHAKSFDSDDDGTSNDTMLARVCIALDPLGPIRLRGFSANLDGIGTLLSNRHDDKEIHDLFLLLMRENLPVYWTEMNRHTSPDHFRFIAMYEKTRPYLDQAAMGQGVERAIYDLDSTSPCRSPLLEADYVVSLDQLLPALERVASSSPGSLSALVDRHIAAFIPMRMKVAIAFELRSMAAAENEMESTLAATRILALVQENAVSVEVPALCAVAVAMLEPCAGRYFNLQRRKTVVPQLKEAAKAGKFRDLLAVIDNADDLKVDEMRYQRAVAEYVSTLMQLARLNYERANRRGIARQLGAQIASLVSGSISAAAILAIILVKIF